MELNVFEDKKTKFQLAVEKRNSIKEFVLNKLYPLRKEYEYNLGNVEYKEDHIVGVLDVLFQYSILEVQLLNGKVNVEDIENIEGVCKTGSITLCIEEAGHPNFHWIDIDQLSNDELKGVLSDLSERINSMKRDLEISLSLLKLTEEDSVALDNFEKMVYEFLDLVLHGPLNEGEQRENVECIFKEIFNFVRVGKLPW